MTNHKIDAMILELAADFRGTLVSEAVADEITVRILGERPPLSPLSGTEIRALRDKAGVTQAAFASILNIDSGDLAQLEHDDRRADGSLLALLHLVRLVGVEPLMEIENSDDAVCQGAVQNS